MQQIENKPHKEARYLVYLLRCALQNETPKEKPEGCSWEVLWQIAKYNNVQSTSCPAIQNYPYEIPEEIAKKWKAAVNNTLYRLLQFELERDQITDQLKKKGIAYLPLKGIWVAEYYPVPGMRWMCDNDILYGYVEPAADGGYQLKGNREEDKEQWKKEAQDALQSIMLDLGYTAEQLGGNHDVYQKKPFFNFEMHQRLVAPKGKVGEYYQNPWKRAIPVEGKEGMYRFPDEDEYIYLIVHAHKHFDLSGCGIRTLVDEYVILNQKQSLDWEYIRAELKKLDLDAFEKRLREAAIHAFAKEGELTSEDWDMIFYMLYSGTYGTLENRVTGKIKKMQADEQGTMKAARLKYIKSRIWADDEVIKEYYPFFYRHKMLQIILPFYRLIKGLCIHPKNLIREWKSVNKMKED